jgi:hypothetical protein
VLKEKTDAWHHGVSPPLHQQRLESLTNALRSLADAGLGAASILANLHHRRMVLLMERELRIYEMSDTANPTALARSRLLHERLPPEYAATRARRAISLKSVPHRNDDLVNDLHVAFDCLRANGVKLNPEKCIFGVPRGMLLGYIVSQRGIEPNPEKVAALDRMGRIRDLKGVQKVLGCLAALSRFISRLGGKGLPLYRLLKKHGRFSWSVEA